MTPPRSARRPAIGAAAIATVLMRRLRDRTHRSGDDRTPGQYKPFSEFQADDASCRLRRELDRRQHAAAQNAAAGDAVGGAALGAATGAIIGAATSQAGPWCGDRCGRRSVVRKPGRKQRRLRILIHALQQRTTVRTRSACTRRAIRYAGARRASIPAVPAAASAGHDERAAAGRLFRAATAAAIAIGTLERASRASRSTLPPRGRERAPL